MVIIIDSEFEPLVDFTMEANLTAQPLGNLGVNNFWHDFTWIIIVYIEINIYEEKLI